MKKLFEEPNVDVILMNENGDDVLDGSTEPTDPWELPED